MQICLPVREAAELHQAPHRFRRGQGLPARRGRGIGREYGLPRRFAPRKDRCGGVARTAGTGHCNDGYGVAATCRNDGSFAQLPPFCHCEASAHTGRGNPFPPSLVLICRNGSHVRKRPCSQIPTKRPLQIAPAALGCDLVFFPPFLFSRPLSFIPRPPSLRGAKRRGNPHPSSNPRRSGIPLPPSLRGAKRRGNPHPPSNPRRSGPPRPEGAPAKQFPTRPPLEGAPAQRVGE